VAAKGVASGMFGIWSTQQIENTVTLVSMDPVHGQINNIVSLDYVLDSNYVFENILPSYSRVGAPYIYDQIAAINKQQSTIYFLANSAGTIGAVADTLLTVTTSGSVSTTTLIPGPISALDYDNQDSNFSFLRILIHSLCI
jgi:hypothetical protein